MSIAFLPERYLYAFISHLIRDYENPIFNFLLAHIPNKYLNKPKIKELLSSDKRIFKENFVEINSRLIIINLEDEFIDISKSGIESIDEIKNIYFHRDRIISINASNNNISNLATFSIFPNLEDIFLNNNDISSLEGLESIPSLKYISLMGNKLKKIKVLENLNVDIAFDDYE